MMNIYDYLGAQYTTGILPNNIRLDVYQKNAPVYISFNILGGNAHIADESKKGLPHFVEHLLTAGTADFPSKDKLAMYLDEFGGQFGGSTSLEVVRLWSYVPDPIDAHRAFYILGSMITRSLLSEKIVENERNAVLTEYKQIYSNMEKKSSRLFASLVFQNTPIETDNLGTEENIQSFSIDDVWWWMNTHITGGNVGITVSGDISYDEAYVLSVKYFGEIALSEINRPVLPIESLFVESRKFSIVKIPSNDKHCHLRMGVRIPGSGNTINSAQSIAISILGERMSSLLNQYLRYQGGLVYLASTSTVRYQHAGNVSIITSCMPEKIQEVVDTIYDCINSKLPAEITPERVEAEKNRKIKSMLKTYETSQDWVENCMSYSLRNDSADLNDWVKRESQVSVDEVRQAATEMFAPDRWYAVYSWDEAQPGRPKFWWG